MLALNKDTGWRVALVLCALLLTFLLAACDDAGSSASATPTSPPAPQHYTGITGFKLTYPGNWHKNASGDQVTFADPVSRDVLEVIVDPNPNARSASSIASQTMSNYMGTLLANAAPVSVSPTLNVAGQTWTQLSATGIIASDPGVQGNLFLLVVDYPANSINTSTYEIQYYGPSTTFGQANGTFQNILQSFQFS